MKKVWAIVAVVLAFIVAGIAWLLKIAWEILKFGFRVIGFLWTIGKDQLPDLTGGAGENVANIKRDLRNARDTWKNKNE